METIDAELANLLYTADLARVIQQAARQITDLQRRVAVTEHARSTDAATIAGLDGRLAMLEAVAAPPWADAGQS